MAVGVGCRVAGFTGLDIVIAQSDQLGFRPESCQLFESGPKQKFGIAVFARVVEFGSAGTRNSQRDHGTAFLRPCFGFFDRVFPDFLKAVKDMVVDLQEFFQESVACFGYQKRLSATGTAQKIFRLGRLAVFAYFHAVFCDQPVCSADPLIQ